VSFSRDLNRFATKAERRLMDTFRFTVELSYESIVNGSTITGAPGQPVDTGALRASWQQIFDTRTRARIITKQAYAVPMEEGIGPHGMISLRSKVGGFHSVKMTVLNFDRVVAAARLQAT
jgi:hypothetical protein